jgi:Cyclopropane fatty acid synthase and related methyltransferases
MGFRPELYTKEYFTGMDAQGNALQYGVEGFHEWQQGKIRDSLVQILSSVPTKGKRVLEMGYGRGESIKYCMTRGASGYVGVDFSEAAFELAKDANRQYINAAPGMPSVEVHLGDGLGFMKKYQFREEFDLIVMLDVIEHIPTSEVAELLPMLYSALKPGGYCLADTPFYRVDEDFIAQGFEFKDPSPSDLIAQTHGMHCNKFTKGRLFSEMKNCGFLVEGKFCFQKPGIELAAWLRAVA